MMHWNPVRPDRSTDGGNTLRGSWIVVVVWMIWGFAQTNRSLVNMRENAMERTNPMANVVDTYS